MGTRAAAFAAKIRNLQEYHTRIANNLFPAPSGLDISNALKYFSQLLLGVLRDVPSIPIDLIQSRDKDHSRTSLFPNLDYKGLYYVIVQLLEILPQIQSGMNALCQTILHTMGCLVPFLEHEFMDSLPYITASAMAVLPTNLHKDLLDMLCYNLLPFTIEAHSDSENLNYANQSVPSIVMIVLNYTENGSYHTQLLECLMQLKIDLSKDLLCVIAYGTAKARCAAVELLFRYWPHLNPSALDRKALSEKHISWTPLSCQHENCASSLSNEAVKMCIDHTIAIGSSERPPPLLICIECADQIYRGRNRDTLLNILLPMEEISYNCENKTCKTPLSQKVAIATCFSVECTNYNCNKPVRYCAQCNNDKHSNNKLTSHIVHTSIPSPWDMDSETQNFLVEAIVSLLREAQPDKSSKDSERHSRIGFQVTDDNQEATIEERQLLSRYGVWLLVGLCAPNQDTPEEMLGRMLSMLCQWFHYTACLPDDQAGSALERLKGECIHGWLMKIIKTHFDVFTACLLPHPLDYARLGGHWECWPSQTNQIKEGFKRLLCLVPYDIITADVWGHIMPYWMECFRHDVPEEELSELKILLSKVLDPDLSPLGLTPKQMYKFISVRFENTSAPVQEQALCWLQILTMLEVPVPLNLLNAMFSIGVKSLTNPNPDNVCSVSKVYPNPISNVLTKSGIRTHITEDDPINDSEINLSCYILMLDILVKQFELQEVSSHKGLETKEAKLFLSLILDILRAPWVGTHTCREFSCVDVNEGEVLQCLYCEMCAIWYQLTLIIIEYFCPVMEVTMADVPGEVSLPLDNISVLDKKLKYDSNSSTKDATKPTQALESLNVNDLIPKQDLKTFTPNDSQIFNLKAATVSEYESNLDFAPAMPIETIIPAVARAVTITEDDVASAKCTVSAALQIVGDSASQFDSKTNEDLDKNFWSTSHGKFKFVIEELAPQYQLIYVFLKEVEKHNDADVLYHLLYCLKLMSLHAEVLNKAAKNEKGFLIWCQENLLIPNLWKLLQSEFSQISQLCVPLLLHCVTLLSGATMFFKLVEQDFHNNNWRARFASVERVTTIAHFVESAAVKNSPLLQTSLANAFCYFIHCLDDIEASVAQRALLNLEMIKTSSLKLLLWCLEVQFDLVIVDRPMILTTVLHLYNHLSDRRILSWDFFLNRFDALFLESQVILEQSGEITQTRDLKNTNINSETYQKKITRAQEALSHAHDNRALSSTFSNKLLSKRTMSAPCTGLFQKCDREKLHNRQSSAPVITRKSSKLAALTGSTATYFPNSCFHDSQIKEIAQEENHLLNVIHKFKETENQDKDTMHLLVFLLMQFLSRADPSHPQDDKTLTRTHQIILRHLNILMGYSPAEKTFLVSPNRLRGLPVFNSFISSLPKVLDFNFKMGNILLSTALPLLLYCPSPQRYIHGNHLPTYSLWLLKSQVRHSWLLSLLIILYKHSFNTQPNLKQIQMLIQIVMNTLESQFHKCRPTTHDHMSSPVPVGSRELSTLSVDLEHIQEQNNIELQGYDDIFLPKFSESAFSSDADDDEKELEAIPESPKTLMSPETPKTETPKITAQREESFSELLSSDINIEPLRQQALIKVVSKSELEESEQLLVIEPISSNSALVISNNSDNTNNKDMVIPPKDLNESEAKPVLHQPVHRVSRQLSPIRPKFQRMEGFEGSLKLKKNKKEKVSVQSHISDNSDHHVLTRNASVDEKKHTSKDVTHKALRNSLSSDNPFMPKLTEKPTKPAWTIEVHSPVKLQPLIPIKPAQERLLPIGVGVGVGSKDVRSFKDSVIKEEYRIYSEKIFHAESDKGVQTMKLNSTEDKEIHFPVCERLLPIGPTPPFTRKDNQSVISHKKIPVSYIDFHAKDDNSVPKRELVRNACFDASNSFSIPVSNVSTIPIATPVLSPTVITPNTPPLAQPNVSAMAISTADNISVIKEKSDAEEAKLKNTNAPVLVGVAKTVKASDTYQTPYIDSVKNSADNSLTDELNSGKEDIKEKPFIEQSLSLEHSFSIDKFEEIQPIPNFSNLNGEDSKTQRQHYRQRKARKMGSSASDTQRSIEGRSGGVAEKVLRRNALRSASTTGSLPFKRSFSSQMNAGTHSPEDIIYERCSRCGGVLEQFSEEEIGLCIVILGTYVHRDASVSAHILPDILRLISNFAGLTTFPWQSESNIHLPGSTASIARQFIRCTLHQLSNNGVFKQIFYAHFASPGFFKSITLALSDFVDLNQVTPLVELFENLNERKHLPHISDMMHMLGNVATYLECISLDSPSQQPWQLFIPQLETFLRKLILLLPDAGVLNLTPLMRIMLSTLKLPVINQSKTILDPYSKVLSHIVQQSPILYEQLLELCNLCCRSFIRERDRFLLTRTIVCELIQAIKFRTLIPDENLMMSVQFILQDAGGTIAPSIIVQNLKMNNTFEIENYNTNACECMRQNVYDLLEFVTDVHTLSRVKSNFLGTSIHLNEETLGGHLKAGISQYLSLEMTKNNGSDHRAIVKYLPWLYSLPSLQQGYTVSSYSNRPKEFIDCVAHIRSLSWLLLGSLQHSALMHNNATFLCQPIPLEANTHIAEHIQVILAGFAEQSKASVLHMSSLFHAFILCQLWTMYCENISSQNPPGSDHYHQCTLTLSDFWAKITPGILQLVCHSKVEGLYQLAETVSLHFLNLMETLMECNSTMLARLLPLWTPVFNSYRGQLSGNTQFRLQIVLNWCPPLQTKDDAQQSTSTMIKWLYRMQTKMSQIEMQSSAAIQFYCI